jgi:hypothetical protein
MKREQVRRKEGRKKKEGKMGAAISVLNATIFTVVEWALELVTGKCRLGRICDNGGEEVSHIMALQVALYFRSSPLYKKEKNLLFDQTGAGVKDIGVMSEEESEFLTSYLNTFKLNSSSMNKPQIVSVYRTYNDIIKKSKGLKSMVAINTTSNGDKVIDHKTNLWKCLESIVYMRNFYQRINDMQSTPVDRKESSHEMLLNEIWTMLNPNVRRSDMSYKSKDWQEIGFQGLDPQTDFRGGGYLALNCIYKLVLYKPTEAIQFMQLCNDPICLIPFCATAINFTVLASQVSLRFFFSIFPFLLSFKIILKPNCRYVFGIFISS